jgi:hypothetical protein
LLSESPTAQVTQFVKAFINVQPTYHSLWHSFLIPWGPLLVINSSIINPSSKSLSPTPTLEHLRKTFVIFNSVVQSTHLWQNLQARILKSKTLTFIHSWAFYFSKCPH